jgi:two-component system, cell cycle sensor histidine kinase and response regulator CckA
MSSQLAVRIVNHHLRAALDQVSDAVLILDAPAPLAAAQSPLIVFANPAAARLLASGISPVGRELASILPPPLQTLVSQAIEELSLPWCSCRDQPLALPPPYPAAQVRALSDSHGQIVNFLLTLPPNLSALPPPPQADSSPEKCLERSRLETLAVVARGIAHDFNNVLTAILANLSYALTTPASPDQQAHLAQAMAAGQRARGFARQILRFARGAQPSSEPLDLAPLLDEAAGLAARGSSVVIRTHVAGPLRPVLGDPAQLVQVFNNLVVNAVQAMPDGGIIDLTASNLAAAPEPSPENPLPGIPTVCLSFRDRGTGIPPEILPRIFDTFFSTKPEGSGIGLATCRQIILAHGGTIKARSKPNVGTEFRIWLPAPDNLELPPPPQAPPSFVNGRGTVLIVDDEPMILRLSSAILTKLGYQVYTAPNAEEALSLFRSLQSSSSRIDLVILDLTLPGGLSGGEAFHVFRQIDPTARILISSGFFDDELELPLSQDPHAGLLPKPYSGEELSAAVAQALSTP